MMQSRRDGITWQKEQVSALSLAFDLGASVILNIPCRGRGAVKTFCHINELAAQGYASLRALVLVSNRVSIWGPSASYLEHLRRYHPLLPTPEELLYYVRNSNVQ